MQGWRVAHWHTAGVAAAGTAQGAVAAHCLERMGAIRLCAPEPHESGRGGALPESVGLAQHSWCGLGVQGPQRGGLVPPLQRSCASTAEVLCLHNGGLVPPPWSLTAAASLQRCYAATTGCSNAPVPLPIKGLLEPAALVSQPGCCSISAALLCCSHWLQQCPSPVTNQGVIGACNPRAVACAPQLIGRTFACCASTAEVLCLHRRSLVPPQRRSGASTAESDCCSTSAALLCCSHWLQ